MTTKTILSPNVMERLLRAQRDEVTSAVVYERMAEREKDLHNRQILYNIADDERRHAMIFKSYTKREVKPDRRKITWYSILAWLLGFTFVIQIMERNEDFTADDYKVIVDAIPEMQDIIRDEERHEKEMHDMLDEERLHYVGAMVLGLNDALVELTGALAGMTFALLDNRLVALAGIITGASATLSMAASNYLAERANGKDDAFRSSLYTGIAYLITVILLVLPYLLLPEHRYLTALVTMLVVVVLIIAFFNYYVSVAKKEPFWPRFKEMACISLGVALVSFVIGLVAKALLNIDV